MKQIVQEKIDSFKQKISRAIISGVSADYNKSVKAMMLPLLAQTEAPEAEEIIIEFLKNNPEEEQAIVAAGDCNTDKAVQLMIQMVNKKNAVLRDVLTEQLGKSKRIKLTDLMIKLLSDSDRQVRFQAAYALYSIGGKDAALAMCRYISDPDEWISMTILRLLCLMKEHETIPVLAKKYYQDEDLRRKSLMVTFLSKFKSATLVKLFDDGIKGLDVRLRANSIEAIGGLELPENEIRSRVEPYLRDPNNRVRANSILALTRFDPLKVKPYIEEMVDSNDAQLRRSAAFLLVMVPPDNFLDCAEKLLKDDSVAVRKRMAQSLKAYPPKFVCDKLITLIKDSDKWIRKHALDMAAKHADFPEEKILPMLRTETASPNLAAVLEFFASNPTEKAMPGIMLHIKDTRPKVIKALLKAVAAINGIEGIRKISQKLDIRNYKVLNAFTETLLKLGDKKTLDDLANKFSTNVKFASNKTSSQIKQLMPAVASAIKMVRDYEQIPEPLKEALSKETPKVEPPPLTETKQQPQVEFEQPQIDIEQPQIDIEQPQPDLEKPQIDIVKPETDDELEQIDIEELSLDGDLPDLDSFAMSSEDDKDKSESNTDISLDLAPDEKLVSTPAKATAKTPSKATLDSSKKQIVKQPVGEKNKALKNKTSPDTLPKEVQPPSKTKKSKDPKAKRTLEAYKKALKAYNLGKYKKASSLFKKLAEKDTTPPPKTYYYLGMIQYEEKNYIKASDNLSAYIKLSPDSTKANYTLGKCFIKLKNWNDTVRIFNKFVNGDLGCSPKMKKRIYFDLGYANIMLENNQRGHDLLKSVLRLEPDNPEIIYYMAVAQYRLNKKTHALELAEKAKINAGNNKTILKKASELLESVNANLPVEL